MPTIKVGTNPTVATSRPTRAEEPHDSGAGSSSQTRTQTTSGASGSSSNDEGSGSADDAKHDSAAGTVQPIPIIAERFKTKMCKNYETTGQCQYGARCMFAHGARELRTTEQNMADGITNQGSVYALRRRMAKQAKADASVGGSTSVAETDRSSTTPRVTTPQPPVASATTAGQPGMTATSAAMPPWQAPFASVPPAMPMMPPAPMPGTAGFVPPPPGAYPPGLPTALPYAAAPPPPAAAFPPGMPYAWPPYGPVPPPMQGGYPPRFGW
mmetsp:Transcript_30456/g.94055  ORF Transcript_30456/g.94055 Transcript_30456/m.94055 type:complete len:269 (-) Transcript_30456:1151-1957(-)